MDLPASSTSNTAAASTRAPLISAASYPLFDKLLFAVFVLAVPPFLASNWSVFRDGDVSWHVAAGRWILEHRQVPTTDPFSFTMAGQPWVSHEWLAEIVYAVAFNAASYAGLAAVVAAALMALNAVLFTYLRSRAGPVAMLVMFAAVNLVLQPFIMARPHVLAWVFVAAWTAILLKRREEGHPPRLWTALIMVVWANLHASFFFGLVIAAAIGLDAWIRSGWSFGIFRRWLLFGIACLVASLVNANGLAGFLHPLNISGMETLGSIGEWQPSTPTATPIFYLVVLGVTGALLWRRAEFTAGEILLLLLTLGMAFWHIRHQAVFVLVAALIVTPKLAGAVRANAPPLFGTTAERGAWIGSAAAIALALLTARALLPLTPRETFSNPHGLIAHIPPALRSQPVFNEYSMGGPLILAGVRPYIDGRADMYGDDYVKTYLKITEGDAAAFNREVRKYGIRWTMLQKDNRLSQVLDRSPEWKRLYADKVGVIHVRREPAASAARAQGQERE